MTDGALLVEPPLDGSELVSIADAIAFALSTSVGKLSPLPADAERLAGASTWISSDRTVLLVRAYDIQRDRHRWLIRKGPPVVS